ncbi:MAG: hypothetical protein KGM96_00610, partial [Acidobacteriota bacterium]|nr:hypothetical protein [Acidobacteriota bacterium]
MIEDEMPVVFTPDNEPYLGRKLVLVFDHTISACLEFNLKCAPKSHNATLSDFQRAACILVPQTISLALSIRELIRQGYVFGAKVLVRPLVERAVTLLYLYSYPADLAIWNDGWEHKKRPGLYAMLDRIREKSSLHAEKFPKDITFAWNSATHGDPFSSQWNVTEFDGVIAHPVS